MWKAPAKRSLATAIALFALLGIAQAATVTTLYKFPGGAGGAYPSGPLIADAQGNLYGVTMEGGAHSYGIVYRLSPPARPGGPWTETTLHNFMKSHQGVDPNAPLSLDAKGNLTGTTFDGGDCYFYCGVAFRLSPAAGGQVPWDYKILFRFSGPAIGNGGAPTGGLLPDGAGGYVGTTQYGGAVTCSNVAGPCGTVFHLTPPAQPGSPWQESLLYSFQGPPDGEGPVGAVVTDQHGNLYGAAEQGGDGHCGDGEGGRLGCGTVFELTQQNGAWSERQLYQFTPKEFNDPVGPLVFGTDGALYGEASYDVFRVMPQANPKKPWTKQVVYTFKDGIDGTVPYYGLALDAAGNLYGSSDSSGLDGFSTVFELTPKPSGALPWTLTTLAKFGKGLDSEQPQGGVIVGADGTLYGVLAADSPHHGHGSVFAISP